jgi:16S rRNA (guanine1207-N2)-methyltransferase
VTTEVSHYFTPAPPVPAGRRIIRYDDGRHEFRFHTAAGVFSRGAVDLGSRLLLRAADAAGAHSILDLGCGYGVIGIVLATRAPEAHVVLLDVNPRAVALTRENITLNGVRNAEARVSDGCASVARMTFDRIMFNPPIRAGRAVVLRLLGEARACLAPGGRLYLVARTNQGARTLGRLMGATFDSVLEISRGSGYRVYEGRRV